MKLDESLFSRQSYGHRNKCGRAVIEYLMRKKTKTEEVTKFIKATEQ